MYQDLLHSPQGPKRAGAYSSCPYFSSRAWKEDYNESRPHTSLEGLAPQEYVAQLLAGDGLEEAVQTENFSQPLVQRWGRLHQHRLGLRPVIKSESETVE